jgi:Tol biopolymer transport system component
MYLLRSLFAALTTLLTLCAFAQTSAPEIFAPGVISGPLNDQSPAFSPDGNTVYFCRRGPGLTGTILVSHLRDGSWTAPEIASFSGQWQDIEPAMAPDGAYLIYASNRPAASGGQCLNGLWDGKHYPGKGGNLWRVDRKGSGWGEPYRLPDIVNSDSSVFSPAIAKDGSLFFMKPVRDTGDFHLYRCAYQNNQYQPPVRLSFSMMDSVGDYDPAVAPDGSFIVFSSGRAPANQSELFIVFRDHDTWGTPVSLGPEVNRQVGNIEARLSPDHRRLYFSCSYVQKPADQPTNREDRRRAMDRSEWDTGLQNIWSVSLDRWLQGHE